MKGFIYFAGGLVIGAGASFLLCRQYYQNEMDDLSDYYIRRCKPEPKEDINKDEKKTSYDTVSSVKEINKSIKAKTKKAIKKAEAVDYAAFGKKEEGDYMVNEQTELTVNPPKGKKIYMITSDDFVERNNYEKEYLTYFEEDDVFLNENNEVIDNGKKLVDTSNLNKINECDSNVMYVRNEIEGTDFEIIFEDGHYKDFQNEV